MNSTDIDTVIQEAGFFVDPIKLRYSYSLAAFHILSGALIEFLPLYNIMFSDTFI